MTEPTITASRRIALGGCLEWADIVGSFPVDLLGGTITQTYRHLYGYIPAASPIGLPAEFSISAPGVPGSIIGWGSPWGSQPLYNPHPNNGSDFGVYGASAYWSGQTIKARWVFDAGESYPALCAIGLLCKSWGHLSVEVSDDAVAWSEVVSISGLAAHLLSPGFAVVPVPDSEIFHRYWSLAATFEPPYVPGAIGSPVPEYLNFIDWGEGIVAFCLWPRSIALRGHVTRAAAL